MNGASSIRNFTVDHVLSIAILERNYHTVEVQARFIASRSCYVVVEIALTAIRKNFTFSLAPRDESSLR